LVASDGGNLNLAEQEPNLRLKTKIRDSSM